MYQILDSCDILLPFLKIIRKIILPIFYIGVPILLILFGIIDLGKAVIEGDEKEQKKIQKVLIRRFIYAILVFLIVAIVTMTINAVGESGGEDTGSWASCWARAAK